MPSTNYGHRKSPYELRNEAFYGGNNGRQHPMIAATGPDPFFAMRGLEMDTTKLNKIFDKWDEEAAAKAQSKGESGGGGGLDGLGDIIGLAVKFAPMLMAFGR
uniref:Uncharacterized protein n=1 Tax=Panagrolaimus sp. ES5 TaxID=591445 RepID=A0AC34G1R8_9BILA